MPARKVTFEYDDFVPREAFTDDPIGPPEPPAPRKIIRDWDAPISGSIRWDFARSGLTRSASDIISRYNLTIEDMDDDAIEAIIRAMTTWNFTHGVGVDLTCEKLTRANPGRYYPVLRYIEIAAVATPVMQLLALAHETAHVIHHDIRPSYGEFGATSSDEDLFREVVAETATHVIANMTGLWMTVDGAGFLPGVRRVDAMMSKWTCDLDEFERETTYVLGVLVPLVEV